VTTCRFRSFCPACGFANTFWGKTTADGTLIEHFAAAARAGLKMTKATVNSAIFVSALKLPTVSCRKRHCRPTLPGV
jgi:hypothetical protein